MVECTTGISKVLMVLTVETEGRGVVKGAKPFARGIGCGRN